MTSQPPSPVSPSPVPGYGSGPGPVRWKEAYDRLQATLEALPDLLFVLDRDGRIYDYHAPALDRLYVPPDSFLGRTMNEVLPEPARGIVDWAIQDAVVHGFHRGSVYPLATPSGNRWFEISIAAQGDPGRPEGRLVAIIRDVTDRRTTLEALRESEQRYRLLAEGMKDVIWVLDVEAGRFTYVSPSVEKLRGYTPEEVLAQPLEDTWAPAERARLAEMTAGYVREFQAGRIGEQTYVTFELQQPCKDGSLIPSEAVARLVRNSRTGRLEAHGVTREIRDRKRVEDALRASEERFAQSARQSRTFLWETDENGLYTFVSPVVEDVLGYRPEELIGKRHYHDLFPESERRRLKKEAAHVIRGGHDFRDFENACRAKDGRTVWVVTSGAPMRDAQGRVRGYRGSDTDITQRREAERELRESRDRLNRAQELAHLGSWELDAVTDELTWSDEVFRIFDLEPEEFAGTYEAFLECVHPEDRADVHAAFAESLHNGTGVYEIEHRIVRRKSREVRWLHEKCFHVRDDSGRLIRSTGMVMDITERRQAEDALKESQARWRALNDNLPGGLVYQIDSGVDGGLRRFRMISRGVEQLHGLTIAEVLADAGRLYGQVLPEDRPQLASRTVQAAKAMTPMHVEMRCRLPSGEIRWIYACAAPRRMPNGHTIWDGIELDITERKRAEEALRKSEAKYRLLHESMRDAFCRTDLNGRILEVNAAFQTLVGYTQEQLQALTYQDLTPKRWHAAEKKILAEQVRVRGYSDIYQKEYRHRDGTIIPVELRTVLIRDESGEAAGMWATVRNITARLRVERALHQATVELEHRVKERTAELEASRQALAESEAQFRQMTDIIQEVFWLIDAKTGDALYVSPAFEQIWGRPPTTNHPSVFTWVDSLHPDDRAHALEVFHKGLKEGRFDPLEVRVVRPDGSLRWIEVRGWLMSPARGGGPRVAGTMRDITMRRQLEAEILNASEAERQRIGRDLHDSLGQSLTGIGYLAEAMKEELSRAGRPESAEAGKLARLVEEAADRAHAMARGLMLVDMRRGGLTAALQELALRTQELFGIECRYEGPDEITLDDMDAAGQLYRIAQEAATNAAKHARADRIVIRLESTLAKLALMVQDTGRGLPEGAADSAGMGLGIMRYRAGLIGASFWIEGAAGRGTAVHCLLTRTPLNHKEEPR